MRGSSYCYYGYWAFLGTSDRHIIWVSQISVYNNELLSPKNCLWLFSYPHTNPNKILPLQNFHETHNFKPLPSLGTTSSHTVSEALRAICKIFTSFIPKGVIAFASYLKFMLLGGGILLTAGEKKKKEQMDLRISSAYNVSVVPKNLVPSEVFSSFLAIN